MSSAAVREYGPVVSLLRAIRSLVNDARDSFVLADGARTTRARLVLP